MPNGLVLGVLRRWNRPNLRRMGGSLTAVRGVEVGHWTDWDAQTGCTVVTFPEPNVAALEVRGAAPGSRETALLAPGMKVEVVQAIVLTGGSAFGLAAADGAVAELAADGKGHETMAGLVPIVPAAVIYDLHVGETHGRPDRSSGAAAYRARSSDPVEEGSVGAGTGATVAGIRGPEAVRRGGLGSASISAGAATVGALAVVNSVGDVFSRGGAPLTGGRLDAPLLERWEPPTPSNTTLLLVATDARLDRSALTRLTVRAQDAVAACVRPSHTRYDGDAAFAVSCGEVEGDVDVLSEAAFIAAAEAIGRAVEQADPSPPRIRVSSD